MTISAHVHRRDMIRNLAYRSDGNIIAVAVMAGFTIAVDTRVTEVQRVPERRCTAANRRGHVTERTVLVRRQMIYYLAGTDNTVMTLRTVTVYADMVKRRIGKIRCVMAIGAILTIGACRYVVRQLTYTDHVVVARSAAINDTGMIIGARAEGARGMAIAAILVVYSARVIGTGRHMIGRLATGRNAMAGLAIVYQARVIDAKCRSETFGVMARSTIGAGDRVGRHR